jgi:ssDNA-binding Zn-finger/Zn-ribbon topoisomerase 1
MSKKKKQEWDPCPNCGDEKLHDMGKGTFDGHDNLLMCHSSGHGDGGNRWCIWRNRYNDGTFVCGARIALGLIKGRA